MKTLKHIVVAAFIGVGINTVAQTAPPAPPAPPSTVYESGTTKVTTNSSNVSVITQNGNYGKTGSTSFSVSNSNDEYRAKGRYPKNRYPAIKEFLLEEMGTKNMQSSGTAMVWSLEGDEDTVYEITLDNNKLKIGLDKTIASPDMISKFNDMGNILRGLISGGDERQEIARLERDADRARLEAERMQREAERLRNTSERDAARLEREATRLEVEAVRLGRDSKRGGGIDGYVREVLRQSSTKYGLNTTDSNGWKWPSMQSALLGDLQKNGLVGPKEDVVFVKEDNGIYVNGKKLGTSWRSKYNRLIRKYDYGSMEEFSFYKQGNHIAVISGPDDLEDVLEQLEDEGLIRSSTKNTVIEINGASVVVDGVALSAGQTSQWNALLHSNGIIPAPGKTIEINKKGMSIGYSFDNKTLGTWVSRD